MLPNYCTWAFISVPRADSKNQPCFQQPFPVCAALVGADVACTSGTQQQVDYMFS